MVTDQSWGCFIPDELLWQYHAMLLVKSSSMNKNKTNLLTDKVQLLHTLWGLLTQSPG